MKKYFLILVTLFITTCITAQKNFQGEITYRFHASSEEKPDAELKILFGVNKLKMRFKEKDAYDKEDLIVLFDSAAVYMLNKENKTYRKRMLKVNSPAKEFQNRTFAGYAATPLTQDKNGLANLFGGLMGTSDVVFYLADSLYYNIPAVFSNNQELIAIQKNKIVLGAEISLISQYSEEADTSAKQGKLITAEAIEIRPMTINEDEFIIPADYANMKNSGYMPVEDSIMSMAPAEDTIMVTLPPSSTKKTTKQPVKSSRPKPVVKPSAAKRKE